MTSLTIQYALLFLVGIVLIAALVVPFETMRGQMNLISLGSRLEAITITTAEAIEHLNERVLSNGISEARFVLDLPKAISYRVFTLTIRRLTSGKYTLVGETKNPTTPIEGDILRFEASLGLFRGFSISGRLDSEKKTHYILFFGSHITIFSN